MPPAMERGVVPQFVELQSVFDAYVDEVLEKARSPVQAKLDKANAEILKLKQHLRKAVDFSQSSMALSTMRMMVLMQFFEGAPFDETDPLMKCVFEHTMTSMDEIYPEDEDGEERFDSCRFMQFLLGAVSPPTTADTSAGLAEGFMKSSMQTRRARMRHTDANSGNEARNAVPSTAPEPAPVQSVKADGVLELLQRLRITRARAPQGAACEIATVLSVAPHAYPTINTHQCDELLQTFLRKPKQTLLRTLRGMHRTERERQLACPVLTALVEALDDAFDGSNWERSVTVYSGTQAQMSVAQFIAELRLTRPGKYIPTETERARSVLLQYDELYTVFADAAFVLTSEVAAFFKGELKKGASQTALEAAGPDCWLVLCERMGYPVKPFVEYQGAFCTDHMAERSMFTGKSSRSERTPADTLSNYAMLLDFFNEQGRMKMFGLEKRGWYGEAGASMAKASMQFRLDFFIDKRRWPTLREFVQSSACKEGWRPRVNLLKRSHPAHSQNRERGLSQMTLG